MDHEIAKLNELSLSSRIEIFQKRLKEEKEKEIELEKIIQKAKQREDWEKLQMLTELKRGSKIRQHTIGLWIRHWSENLKSE